jgi:hypothetical protein
MRHINLYQITIILTSLIFCNCSSDDDTSLLKNPYLGQEPPGGKPEVFAPGLVSTEMQEFGCSFTPDGTQFYFTQVNTQRQQNKMTIMVSRLGENGWSKPEIAAFCGNHFEGEPTFSADGQILLYARLLKFNDGSQDSRIMIAEKTGNGWSEPRDLMRGMFATITKDSIIYYTDVSQGHSKADIYRTKYSQGNIQKPEKLKGKINTPQQDAHPFATPEGDILIFDSNRRGGYGDNDLYICFRQNDGRWSDPINMGMIVNTQKYDAIPYLTYDRKYFFFFRNNDIYWVNTGFIEQLKSSVLE